MLRGRITRRIIVMATLAVGLLVCCSIVSLIRTGGNTDVAKDPGPPIVRLSPGIDVGLVRSVSFSPCGRFFSTVKNDGTVTVHTSSGRQLFSVKVPDATDAVLSHDGRFALAYSRLDPTNGNLTFLDSQGRVCWQLQVAGAVWSADAYSTDRGARFVVGTGERYIYVIDIADKRRNFRRWRVPGAVTSVVFTAQGDHIIYATWQDSVIGRCTLRGGNIWQQDAESSSLHYIERLERADRILVRAVPNRFGTDGSYMLLDGAGERISNGELSADENARVLAAPNGQYLCIGVDKLIRHKGKSMRERHAVLLDASGNVLCEKGSPFFQADPILVTTRGYVLLSNPKHEIFTMSPTGHLKSSLKLSSAISRMVASRDGSRLLLQCRDGSLYILSASYNDAATARR